MAQFALPTSREVKKRAQRLAQVKPYGRPRKVWVDDGHVFFEAYDGQVFSMTPEVAIDVSRVVGQAGTDALVNKILEAAAQRAAES